jgi:hypothetical protein
MGSRYRPEKVKGNFGPGGLRDQYDNEHMRSVDRDQNPGGVTGIPYEDEFDLEALNFSPQRGESRREHHPPHDEPLRDVDLSVGDAGTDWNRDIDRPGFYGHGPKGWKLGDEKLRERISEVLLHSHEVDPSDFEVEVKDSVAYLRGEIESRGMKRVAVDLVGSIPGVEDVFTELKIKKKLEFFKN